MFINKLILLFVSSLSIAQASTSSLESDVYGHPVPKPYWMGGIKYSTPALLGIEANHLSMEEVEKAVRFGNKIGRSIRQGNICLLVRDLDSLTEVSSVWKE